MLKEIYPRDHARFSSLPLLGPHVEGFVEWLHSQGYPRLPIRLRVQTLPRIEGKLRRFGVGCLENLQDRDLRRLAPKDSQDDVYLAATVRSLAIYFATRQLLAPDVASPAEQLVRDYSEHLDRVRGFAESTRIHHKATAAELLGFVGYQGDPSRLRGVGPQTLEAFLCSLGERLSRESLQHAVAHLRSFLRYLANRALVRRGLDSEIDTPRVYRGERLPRALTWETVQALLASIDRSTAMGTRDYAMLLLIATYGLRTSEVARLRLDDVGWRAMQLHIRRPKTKSPLVLPLTTSVAGALIDYGSSRPTRRAVS